ncbi:MAG: thiol reductase thioredoxin [Frankiales bacterium]|jgi:thiol-disulfide isomerase/thioredoxin|nr:thiol reductase thioredoxin [Frankiales bacterium]
MTGLVILCVAVGLTLIAGTIHRRRDGRVRETRQETSGLRSELDALGERPGERATLLQFSSAFCAPCRATRRTLSDVAEMVEGVVHIEVDAEQNLDLVRRLGIVKTPTTLVLDAGTVEVKRASGQPRKADVLAALGHALP